MSNVPTGTIDIEEVLQWLQTDCHFGVRQAAEYLGMSERKFSGLLKGIPKYKVGGQWLIKRSELDSWMQQFRVEPTSEDVEELVDGVLAEVGE